MLSAQVRVILNPRRKKNGQVGKKEVLEAKEAKDGKHPPVHLPNPNGPSREGGPDEVDKERHPRRGEGGEGIPASEGNRDHADVAAVIDSDVVLTVLIADTTDDPIDDREVGGAKAEADGAVRTSERGCVVRLAWLVLGRCFVMDVQVCAVINMSHRMRAPHACCNRTTGHMVFGCFWYLTFLSLTAFVNTPLF
eukprot:g31500.t1